MLIAEYEEKLAAIEPHDEDARRFVDYKNRLQALRLCYQELTRALDDEIVAERALAGRWARLKPILASAADRDDEQPTTSGDREDEAAALERRERDLKTLKTTLDEARVEAATAADERRFVSVAIDIADDDQEAEALVSRAYANVDAAKQRRATIEKLKRQTQILDESLEALRSRFDVAVADAGEERAPISATQCETTINQLSVGFNCKILQFNAICKMQILGWRRRTRLGERRGRKECDDRARVPLADSTRSDERAARACRRAQRRV